MKKKKKKALKMTSNWSFSELFYFSRPPDSKSEKKIL